MDKKKKKETNGSETNVVEGVVVHGESVAAPVDVKMSFESHVSRFRKEILANRKRSLRIVWEIGTFVNLLKGEKVYGDHSVTGFVEAMGDDAVSTKEVYKWAQFAESHDLTAVNKLLGMSNVSWGVVSNLIRIKDEDSRWALAEKVDSGEIKPSKLQDVVSEYNKAQAALKGGDEDKGGSPTKAPIEPINKCKASFKKLNNLLDSVLTCQHCCAKDITDLSAILDKEDIYESAVDEMEAFIGRLSEVRAILTNLEEQLNKTI